MKINKQQEYNNSKIRCEDHMSQKIDYFDKKITPACEYCELGRDSSEYNMILCRKKGVVSPYFRCRSFKYNPLRRIPKRDENKKTYSPSDFSL